MIVGIVQARMGSSRFPGKTLMEIEGKPMLWHVVDRLRRVRSIDRVVIATTVKDEDSVIVRFALENGIVFFRGDADDVLDRFYTAALENKADTVVRVTSDCPLCSPDIIEKVMKVHLEGGYDYTANTLVYSYPEGTDVEVFSFGALEEAWKVTKEKYFREHVTPYLRDERKFRIKNVQSDIPVDVNKHKWSVDTMDDLIFVRGVYKRLYAAGEVFTADDVLDLLREKPGISVKTDPPVINEGYYKSFIDSGDVEPRRIDISVSQKLAGKVAGLIPGMSQTFSKGPTQFVQGVAPVFAEKASGCRIWDVDNNEFIDYSMALGAVILGHAYPAVENSVIETIRKGTTFTLPHRLEGELAGLISETVPSAEMVRFGKNGSDATSGAVRAARAYTGKDKIACSGYHGWQDWFIGTTARNDGVPKAVRELTIPFEYNRVETLEKIFRENKGEIACVIMEPAGIREPENGFLEAVKDLAHSNGALLIFDAMMRIAMKTAAQAPLDAVKRSDTKSATVRTHNSTLPNTLIRPDIRDSNAWSGHGKKAKQAARGNTMEIQLPRLLGFPNEAWTLPSSPKSPYPLIKSRPVIFWNMASAEMSAMDRNSTPVTRRSLSRVFTLSAIIKKV
ncbi:MAG: aminotransferase class III-fold pyridoxal phosphate-dependent enzyme [Candidatus Omnitrophica bacterium]|nr:aminotransferase class III-fold pyridoxal phosphate-dependent enzyme [Candidatus Omnitrophota bacterium]